MITEKHLNKIWKRTVIHLIMVGIVAVGIVIYLVVDDIDGNGLNLISALALLFLIAAVVFVLYVVMKAIKSTIGRWLRQDEQHK